jgi:hypothetical protein
MGEFWKNHPHLTSPEQKIAFKQPFSQLTKDHPKPVICQVGIGCIPFLAVLK